MLFNLQEEALPLQCRVLFNCNVATGAGGQAADNLQVRLWFTRGFRTGLEGQETSCRELRNRLLNKLRADHQGREGYVLQYASQGEWFNYGDDDTASTALQAAKARSAEPCRFTVRVRLTPPGVAAASAASGQAPVQPVPPVPSTDQANTPVTQERPRDADTLLASGSSGGPFSWDPSAGSSTRSTPWDYSPSRIIRTQTPLFSPTKN
ncbi:unnamed protein product [Vitrella brassicaformis CCMP3155]|uniref:Uncharacterized protein n=1 Tax=Vitrella brassicaformis (strain CCMP3155) TaxID=1169540 RepID=A0A0G4EMC6_VITBC|nr:unnamed protein product [Vitrella brassicaformis CCMP3155]|eukprot:CEL98319.1 unnamed protein product [Vitrella brassicaformis CCMP3155]